MIHIKSLTLIVMTGLPGCGKTTVISDLRRLVDLAYVGTDACWKKLFAQPKYTPEESRAVFEALAMAVEKELREKLSVVAEGVFASHERIIRLREIADLHGAKVVIVGVECDFEIALQRMKERQKSGGNGPVPEKLWMDLRVKLGEWKEEGVSWIDTASCAPMQSAQQVIELLASN
jgi:predicted kinase